MYMHVTFDLVNELFPVPIRNKNQKQFTFTCKVQKYMFRVLPWHCVNSPPSGCPAEHPIDPQPHAKQVRHARSGQHAGSQAPEGGI